MVAKRTNFLPALDGGLQNVLLMALDFIVLAGSPVSRIFDNSGMPTSTVKGRRVTGDSQEWPVVVQAIWSDLD